MLCRTTSILAISVFFTVGCSTRHEGTPQDRLSNVIGQADKIVVFESELENAKVLFSSTASKDIAEFNDALAVVPPKDGFKCACIAAPAVRLYRGGTELVLVTNYGGFMVGSSLWGSDAMIKDPEKWLKWFGARNMPRPREEFEESRVRAEKAENAYTRWLAAMPKSIQPLWEQATRDELSPNTTPLREALNRDIPKPKLRAMELFSWYGSGAGPWSGYPSYEGIAEELLLDIPTPELIAAAQADNLTDAQLEGAARLFGGWGFSQKRTGDGKLLPARLKKKLLEHALKSTDEDKLDRAKDAFSQ